MGNFFSSDAVSLTFRQSGQGSVVKDAAKLTLPLVATDTELTKLREILTTGYSSPDVEITFHEVEFSSGDKAEYVPNEGAVLHMIELVKMFAGNSGEFQGRVHIANLKLNTKITTKLSSYPALKPADVLRVACSHIKLILDTFNVTYDTLYTSAADEKSVAFISKLLEDYKKN